MIIPSIDLMGGNAVQLVEGKEKVLDAGDPGPIADRFGMVGEVAVIDLDAALGRGSNASVIRELLKRAPCRVGGGIRDAGAAIRWLDAGARKVILGTAARPEILRELPRERVIAALDAQRRRGSSPKGGRRKRGQLSKNASLNSAISWAGFWSRLSSVRAGCRGSRSNGSSGLWTWPAMRN